MNENQDQQFTDDDQQPELTMTESLQLLADLLNETPRRKTSLSFFISWFFGNRGVLTGLLNFVFWGVPALFIIPGAYLGFKSITDPSDKWWILGIVLASGLGFVLFRPYWKAYRLFKNGFFTLGYLTDRGLVYKDSSGNQHYWIPTRFYRFSQPYMDCIHSPDEPYLVVIGSNPKNLLILDAAPYSEDNDVVGFRIFMGLYALFVSYNLQTRTFVDKTLKAWRWIIPIGIVLWTLLWFYAVFLTEVQ